MNITKIRALYLHLGAFFSLCHAVGVLLFARLSSALPPLTSFGRYFPMIEHSMTSLAIVLAVSCLLSYIEKRNEEL